MEQSIEKARRHLRALMSSRNCAPLMLHLAWHDAGTYDAKTKTGGPNGSIRNKLQGYKHGPNNALKIAIDFCEEVKAKHPEVTYADLYQLAGVVAVEVTGGPTIHFVPGRKDSDEEGCRCRCWCRCHPDDIEGCRCRCRCHPDDIEGCRCRCHPDDKQGASHLRETTNRMGLSDKDIVTMFGVYTLGRDIVTLSGGYTLGRACKDKSDYKGQACKDKSDFKGPWTKDPLKFDNSYFVELLKGESEGLLKRSIDKALVEDPKFRPYVELYAKDEDAFFRDYAALHKKLSELGLTFRVSKVAAKLKKLLAQGAVPVAVAVAAAAALLILSNFYEVHERTRPLISVASFIHRILCCASRLLQRC